MTCIFNFNKCCQIFKIHCSSSVLFATYEYICVSPLPMTSTFCLEGHRLLYFKSKNFMRLCLIVDPPFSVLPGTLRLSFWKFICYFSNIFLIIPLNPLFPFHYFGSLPSGLQLYVCFFPLSDFRTCHFPFLFFLSVPPSGSHAMFSVSSLLLVPTWP